MTSSITFFRSLKGRGPPRKLCCLLCVHKLPAKGGPGMARLGLSTHCLSRLCKSRFAQVLHSLPLLPSSDLLYPYPMQGSAEHTHAKCCSVRSHTNHIIDPMISLTLARTEQLLCCAHNCSVKTCRATCTRMCYTSLSRLRCVCARRV